ncbi:MAG: Ribonuclease [Verrucomicrobiaceae bacterium]|nr:Ribonuclease [Verrucomicrobiaceae bacterium]
MPSLDHEHELRSLGYLTIAGVDEVGRGPLAGPVCAAAAILPHDFHHEVLDDSKKLSEKQRETIYEELTTNTSVVWCCKFIEVEEIDRINILQASRRAMRKAVAGLKIKVDAALIDGLPVPKFPVHQRSLVKGDSLSFSIAAASVIAKVTRDRLMHKLAKKYPNYGFEKHKGYGTPLHLEALRTHGPCIIHRRSFSPVAQQTFDFSE